MPSSDIAAQRRAVTRCRNGSKKKGQLLRLFLGAFVGAMGLAGIAEARECGLSATAFEAEIQAYLAEVHHLAAEVENRGLPVEVSLRDLANEADLATQTLTAEQEDALCEFFASHPSIRQAPRNLTFSVRQLPQSLDSGVAARGSAETAGSVQLCLTQDLRTAVDLTNKAADLAGIVAQAICDAAPSGDFVIVNTVLCPIAGVLKGVAKVAEFITKVDDVCRLFEQVFKLNQVEEEIDEGFVVVGLRLDDIEGDIDILARQVSVDGLALQVGDVEAGVSDLDLELDSVRIDLDEQKHDREEFQSLNLRISIEQLLGSEQNDRISLFQLPEAVGGKLENVREVVAMAILMNDDAGKNIDQALVSFAQGDTHFNNQEYSLAFSSYRQAYREAAQVGTSPGLGVKN